MTTEKRTDTSVIITTYVVVMRIGSVYIRRFQGTVLQEVIDRYHKELKKHMTATNVLDLVHYTIGDPMHVPDKEYERFKTAVSGGKYALDYMLDVQVIAIQNTIDLANEETVRRGTMYESNMNVIREYQINVITNEPSKQ